ncbi:MAG: PHP domain-containing protein [Acidimicrobiales bacterium]|nr:PHP domain-containing protein [Acidimicrobiales bacterium]
MEQTDSAGDPGEYLRRIAYLLERQHANTYRVRAFRQAAEAVGQTGPERLAALHLSGRLADLPGIGPTTAQIVGEALEGRVPGYLQELESQPVAPLSPEALRYRARLSGDCHSHSDWSDGGSSIREMAEAAAALGHSYLVLTDHSPRLTVAHGLDAARLSEQLDVVAALNEELAPFRILTGIEVDILEDGSLDQDLGLLADLDVVVASVHSKLGMEARFMTQRMLRAIESPHTDILGHCTGRKLVGRGRKPSAFDAEAVFAACAATGTAVEINSRPERRDPPAELISAAIDAGCLFSIDTDAHAPGQLEWLGFGCEQAAEVAVPPDRVVNGWTLDEVLAWAGDRAVPSPPG